MQFVGILVGRGDQFAAAAEDERRSRAPDLELGKETRKSRIFDDNGEDALAFLIDIDRSRKCERRTRADRMINDVKPLRAVGAHAGLEPGTVGDKEIGRLETASLEFDVARNHLIFVDPALADMVSL